MQSLAIVLAAYGIVTTALIFILGRLWSNQLIKVIDLEAELNTQKTRHEDLEVRLHAALTAPMKPPKLDSKIVALVRLATSNTSRNEATEAALIAAKCLRKQIDK
jgi:hypothetical protein